MPITFIDIERQKSWRIAVFFIFLVVLYFMITFALFISFYEIFSIGFIYKNIFHNTRLIAAVFAFSAVTASIHFFLSSSNAVHYIKNNLGAAHPDPEDRIHKRLTNVMDEIHAVTGKRIEITPLVVPSLSMNALSAVDLKGNAIIAITEGLLSRTSRPQLEAVMAHEAFHILSGDCLESTVAASIFGIPSAAIEKVRMAMEGRLYFSPAFVFAWLMVKAGLLLNMFISREREYRADAGAGRMTRDPLALAEVLHMLSRTWRGAGHLGMGLEMLCIMNTSSSSLDESDGWIANLMSTHPPVKKRISILLNMARASISDLRDNVIIPDSKDTCRGCASLFYALDNTHQWQGPYSLLELAAIPWLTTNTWMSKDGQKVEKATQVPLINALFRERLVREEKSISPYMCPSCRHLLVKKAYEGTSVYQCKFCGGVLVDNRKLPRIIARTDGKFSDRIKSLSKTTLRKNQLDRIARNRGKVNNKNIPLIPCPKCNDNMMRTFYSNAYLLELDRCTVCGVTWFDYNELEMLQCMIENKMASTPLPVDVHYNNETIPSV